MFNNTFKYITNDENPIGNMLIAISKDKGEPPMNITFKIINKESNIELFPCAKMFYKCNIIGWRNFNALDVFHKVNNKWKRMDCLEYPNNNWTWEKI